MQIQRLADDWQRIQIRFYEDFRAQFLRGAIRNLDGLRAFRRAESAGPGPGGLGAVPSFGPGPKGR
jgi:hypothetical protein